MWGRRFFAEKYGRMAIRPPASATHIHPKKQAIPRDGLTQLNLINSYNYELFAVLW